MKIVAINITDSASTGRIMCEIQNLSLRKGTEYYTYSLKPRYKKSRKETKYNKYFSSFSEYAIHYFQSKYTGLFGFGSVIGTTFLVKHLKKIKPDIIHLHNLHNAYINLPILFNYINNNEIHVVWTLHDCWAFTGKCPHYEYIQCYKWITGCHSCEKYRNYPESVIDRTSYMWKYKRQLFCGVHKMHLVTPSKWLKAQVEQSYLRKFDCRVINNGIDLTVFKPTDSSFRSQIHIDKEKFLILGVASVWGKSKGLDVFCDLAEKLDDRFRIVLVGINDQLAAKLPNSITAINRTNNQGDLAKIYSACDLFVNPTREDTFPTVNIEALACGTPVLTFLTGGSPEILNDKCGKAVPVDDINQMVQQIMFIFEERPYSREYCVQRAKCFDKNVKLKEYIHLYDELIKRRSDC